MLEEVVAGDQPAARRAARPRSRRGSTAARSPSSGGRRPARARGRAARGRRTSAIGAPRGGEAAGVEQAAVVVDGRLADADGVGAVAGQGIAVGAGLPERAAAVEQAGRARGRLAAHPEARAARAPTGGPAAGGRRRGPAPACRGPRTRTTRSCSALAPPARSSTVPVAVARTARTSSATSSSRSAPASASNAARARMTPPSSSNTARPSYGASIGSRSATSAPSISYARTPPASRITREPPLGGLAERDDAVAGEQLAAEALLPVAPHAARLARERDEAAVLVRVAEDPRLAARLAVAGNATLVDGHRRAALGQRERGREPDDPGADHRDVRPGRGHRRRLDGGGDGQRVPRDQLMMSRSRPVRRPSWAAPGAPPWTWR